MTALSAGTRSRLEELRRLYPHPRSAVLPSLWAVQDELGWLAPEGMAEVAEVLEVAASEVQAVATFYSMYFKRPQGNHHVLVCVNAPCALRGADEVVTYLERKLGCASGTTTADGIFTWESTIECLGACGYAPMMQVDHHFHEHLTPDRIDAVLERYAAMPAHGGRGHAGAAADDGGGDGATTTTEKPRARRAPRAGTGAGATVFQPSTGSGAKPPGATPAIAAGGGMASTGTPLDADPQQPLAPVSGAVAAAAPVGRAREPLAPSPTPAEPTPNDLGPVPDETTAPVSDRVGSDAPASAPRIVGSGTTATTQLSPDAEAGPAAAPRNPAEAAAGRRRRRRPGGGSQ